MKSKNELVGFLKKQIEVENKIVDSINNALNEMANPVVKGTLKGISLDSVKHAEMYAATVQLLTSTPSALSQELTQYHLEKQKKLVEKHISMEAELIKQISEIIPNIENEKVKLLLNAILQDEKKHHELLTKILEILVRGETVAEEWWNVLRTEYMPRW